MNKIDAYKLLFDDYKEGCATCHADWDDICFGDCVRANASDPYVDGPHDTERIWKETKMTKVNIVDPKKCESTICRSGGTNTDESKLDKRLAAGKLCFCYECLEELNAGRMALGCAPYEARD